MSTPTLKNYILSANLGSRKFPLPVEVPVGKFEDSSKANSAAAIIVKNCTAQVAWELLEEGHATGYKLNGGPRPDRGVEYRITINGESLGDIEDAIEQVKNSLDYTSGFDSNETGSYSFERFGEFVEQGEDEE